MKRRSAGPLLPFAWARQHGVLAVDGQSGIQMYCHPETSHAGLMEAYRCLPGEPALARLEVEAFDQRLVAHYQQESGQAQKMIDDLGGELDFTRWPRSCRSSKTCWTNRTMRRLSA